MGEISPHKVRPLPKSTLGQNSNALHPASAGANGGTNDVRDDSVDIGHPACEAEFREIADRTRAGVRSGREATRGGGL